MAYAKQLKFEYSGFYFCSEKKHNILQRQQIPFSIITDLFILLFHLPKTEGKVDNNHDYSGT